jgi:Na+-translocating ferredoxin:NAD+ oxidoreductase RNF subunit RnfB
MSLGDLADLYVEEGWARKLNESEALDLARKNEEEGLVLMPENAQNPSFMCACCDDCCGMLSLMKNFPKPAEIVGHNFFAEIDKNLCKACETCADRCPIDAVSLKDTTSAVNLKRCIGCGLCITTCPENAISLINKDKRVLPPKTTDDMLDSYLAQKSTLSGKIKNYSIKTFLRVASRFTN